MSEEIKDTAIVGEETEIEETEKVDQPEEKELKYTDKDIDEIVNSKFAKWQEKKEEEINEAKKLADMNAQEKAEHERDKLESELNELRNAQTKNEMTSTARLMLKEDHINIEDDLLKILVDVDADKTKENVDSFTKSFNSAVEKEVISRIKNPNDKRGTTSSITKEEIMNITDRETRQAKIKQHMNLFN